MKFPVLLWSDKDKQNKPNEALMNKALLLLHGLQRELENPFWTKEVLAQYTPLCNLTKPAFISFLTAHWFTINDFLTYTWFEGELSIWINNPQELITRAVALQSFLLHQIHHLATLARHQSILSHKQITTLVENTTKLYLQMVSPRKKGE